MSTSTNLKNNKPTPRICLPLNCLGRPTYLHLPFYPQPPHKASIASDATYRNNMHSKPDVTLPHINQYPNTTPNLCFSSADERCQNVLTAPLLPSNATSPHCNPLTNAHALTTPSTGDPAITHRLFNSNHATRTRHTINAYQQSPIFERPYQYPNYRHLAYVC